MHHKNIKRIIRKQLKKQYPNWNRLKRQVKKHIIQDVMAEYACEYDFNQEVSAPQKELLGIEIRFLLRALLSSTRWLSALIW